MTNALQVQAEPGQATITMTRQFDAPKDLVFRCFVDPDLIPKWWGPKVYETVVDKMEVRKGGIWRYVQTAEGQEHAFNGVYHEVLQDERIIYTFEYEPLPGHVILTTLTLEERDGSTLLTEVSSFQSVDDRDGMIEAGMEHGAAEGLDRMEELLTTLMHDAQEG